MVEGINLNVIVGKITPPCSSFFMTSMKIYRYCDFIIMHDVFHFFIIKGNRTRGQHNWQTAKHNINIIHRNIHTSVANSC